MFLLPKKLSLKQRADDVQNEEVRGGADAKSFFEKEDN